MANSTLAAIRTKVRRITRSPSANQLSNSDIDEYVNTFIQYDLPEHLRLFSLRTNLKFFTQPNVDTYATNAIPNNPLNNFKNVYTTIHEPIYIAGYQVFFTQSQSQFFNIYPKTNSIQDTTLRGNGILITFTGVIPGFPTPPSINSQALLRQNVTFSSIGANNLGLVLKDVPFNNQFGNLIVPDAAAPVILDPLNNIDYLNGNFTITFPAAPANGEIIYSETVPYNPARPTAVLYYDDVFTIRPVPDKVYPVEMEAYIRPTELLSSIASPELEQWWQYISFGASRKVFEDRMDLDSLAQIQPLFKEQERLVQRKTIVQMTNERTATIFTEQVNYGNFGNWWNSGSI